MRSKRVYYARRTNEFLAMNVFSVFLSQILETQPFLFFFAKPAKHSVRFFLQLSASAVGTFVIFLDPSNNALNVKGMCAFSFEVGLFLVADAALLLIIYRSFSPNPYFWFLIRC